MTIDFDFSDFSPDTEEEFEIDLETLRKDGEEVLKLKEILSELAEEQKALEAQVRHFETKRIPYVMKSIGMNEFKLSDGSKVRLTEDIQCGQLDESKAYFQFAKKFAEDNDSGGLFKTKVELEFGRGSDNQAKALVDDLKLQGYEPTIKETVHASTWKSFGKDLLRDYEHALENGENVDTPPFAELGMFVSRKAEVKGKKK